MKVFRVENNLGHGPIYGVKETHKEWFDYRNNEQVINYYKQIASNEDNTFDETELYGYDIIEKSYDSRYVMIDHKTPKENKPYFHNRYGIGTFGYYRFTDKYSFGWISYSKCINFIKKGRKNNWILHREGFYISEYETNDKIIFPDGQIAFYKNKAKLVKKYKNCFT